MNLIDLPVEILCLILQVLLDSGNKFAALLLSNLVCKQLQYYLNYSFMLKYNEKNIRRVVSHAWDEMIDNHQAIEWLIKTNCRQRICKYPQLIDNTGPEYYINIMSDNDITRTRFTNNRFRICYRAIAHGNMKILEKLISNISPEISAKYVRIMVRKAAGHGHTDILIWLDNNYHNYFINFGDEIIRPAAENGHMNVLDWYSTTYKYTPNYDCLWYAAGKSCISVMDKLMRPETGIVWDGSLLMYRVLTDRYYQNIKNRFVAVRWLHDKGIPLVPCVYGRAFEHGDTEMIYWLLRVDLPRTRTTKKINKIIHNAFYHGNLSVLILMYNAGDLLITQPMCDTAIQYQHDHILIWLLQNNLMWNDIYCATFCKKGNIQFTEWAHTSGLVYVPFLTIEDPYEKKYLAILQWIYHNHRCVFDDMKYQILWKLISVGHFEIIKWFMNVEHKFTINKIDSCFHDMIHFGWDNPMDDECLDKYIETIPYISKNVQTYVIKTNNLSIIEKMITKTKFRVDIREILLSAIKYQNYDTLELINRNKKKFDCTCINKKISRKITINTIKLNNLKIFAMD